MKICFIVGAFPNMKCGIGDYTSKLAKELVSMGNVVSVITSENASYFSDTNMEVHNIIRNWNFRSLKILINKIKQIQPDVVNIQLPSAEYKKSLMINFLPFFIKAVCKCKIIETVHEYTIFTILGRIRNWISFIKADEIIVVEKEYIKEIGKIYKKKKVTYIPIASNIQQSKINEGQKIEIRKKLKAENVKLISYFGFVNQTKGIEDLLYAFKEIPNAKLLLIGSLDKDNEYQNSIIELAKKIGINNNIIVTGFIKEKLVADYLKCSDVCVLPFKTGVAKRNGSFLAAFNQNIPVVTTTRNEPYIDRAVYYARICDKDQLINYIKMAIENKEKICRKIITWDSIAKKYQEVFEGLKR